MEPWESTASGFSILAMSLAFDPAYLGGKTDQSVGGDDELAPLASHYLNLRKLTIFGGSNEIQRNVISKMILGL